jgi:hypothetical protein
LCSRKEATGAGLDSCNAIKAPKEGYKMRKLPLILLATVLVLGFSAQVGATVSFFESYDEVGFSGDETLIEFTGIGRGVAIEPDQYEDDDVTFPASLYGEDLISVLFLSGSVGASNMNLMDPSIIPEPVITINFLQRFRRVGFDVVNYGGDNLAVTVYRGGSEVDAKASDRSAGSFIGIEDPEGIDAITMSGNGSFNNLPGVIVFDNLRFEEVVEDAEPVITPANVDIKPGNCMNPLNIRSKGVLRVAIHTDENLDATQVDPTTVLLMGVASLAYDLDYVPNCTSDEPVDDDLDLVLKFDTVEIIKAIGDVDDGTVLTLQLTGNLYDGKEIAGEDVVAILGKPKKEKSWKKHPKKHWSEHPKERSQKNWLEKFKDKWHAFIAKWKSKHDK